MYNITDIETLGADYEIADPNGTVISVIQIIPYTEILAAISGPYTEESGSYTSYIEKCREALTGIEDIDPNRVLWFSTTNEEVAISEIIEYAVKHDYNKIILEHLEELE